MNTLSYVVFVVIKEKKENHSLYNACKKRTAKRNAQFYHTRREK